MPKMPDEIEVYWGPRGHTKTMAVTDVSECRDTKWGGRGCGAEIFWCATGKVRDDGRDQLIPVDVEEDEQGLHQPHWVTCPNAESFRRPEVDSRRPGVGDRAR